MDKGKKIRGSENNEVKKSVKFENPLIKKLNVNIFFFGTCYKDICYYCDSPMKTFHYQDLWRMFCMADISQPWPKI